MPAALGPDPAGRGDLAGTAADLGRFKRSNRTPPAA